MTRRDFQLIAGVLSEFADELERETFARMVRRFGDELYGTNPRFDRGRFERACDPEDRMRAHLIVSQDAVDGKRAELQAAPMR